MNVIGRYASIPLVAVLGSVTLYRRMEPPIATPDPSPMVFEFPDDVSSDPVQEPGRPDRGGSEPLWEGILKMARAGLSDETIAAYARSVGFRPTVNDLIELKENGASEGLLGRLAGAPPPSIPEVAPVTVPVAPQAAVLPRAPDIEIAAPATHTTLISPVTYIYPSTEIVVEAPPPTPGVVEGPIYGGLAFRPTHRHAFRPFAREPRVSDPSFRTIPFIPNLPMPAASIVGTAPVRDQRVHSR